jgi:hypothetical protein
MARPSLTNRTKRFRLYRKFWQLLSHVGFWHHPTYLRRKQDRTVVHDERNHATMYTRCKKKRTQNYFNDVHISQEIQRRFPNPEGVPYTGYRSAFEA